MNPNKFQSDHDYNEITKNVYVPGDDLLQGENFTLAELGIVLNQENTIEDKKEVFFLLNDVLAYPSSQLASLHRDCDRIGNYDLDVKYQEMNKMQNHDSHIICLCCGFRKQQDTVSSCTSSQYIKIIGLPTLLYFSTIKHVAALLFISSFVYSIYALASNLIVAKDLCERGIDCSILMISLSAKRLSQKQPYSEQYRIQSWLGLANVVVIGCYFFFMTWRLRRLQIDCELQKSVADFSILVEQLPANINQDRFQQILNQYYNTSLKDVAEQKKRPFQIVTFNIAEPFYMNPKTLRDETLQSYKKQFNSKLQQFRDWIKIRIQNRQNSFRVPKQQRQVTYLQFNSLKQKIVNKTHQLLTQISQQYRMKFNQKTTNTVFVTFRHQLAAHLITRKNRNDYASKIRDFIKSIRKNQRLSHPDLQGAKISKAPEPEDVIWSNVGVPDCEVLCKKFVTFGVSGIILTISFGIIIGLSYLQESNAEDQIISFIISLVIMIVNVVLELIIKLLTIFQKNFTKTNYETSFAMKVVIAQAINAVVFTFICNFIIKQNLYEPGGLTHDVFFLALSGGFVAPIMRFFDVGYFIKRILLLWRDKPEQKLGYNQANLNDYFEGTKFDLASGYVYLVKIYIYCSFYISLQPIISFIALLGLLFMYWAEKYTLLQRSTRPPNGSDILSSFMNQILFLCPIFFALGSLTWPVFVPDGKPKDAILPGLITLGIATLFFIVPLDTIFTCTIKEQSLDHIYEQERIYFTTQYDRRNPATSQEGNKNYLKFLQDQQRKAQKGLDGLSSELLVSIANLRAKSQMLERGRRRRRHEMKNSPFDATGLIAGIFGAELEDSNNPLKLAQAQADLAQKDTSEFMSKIVGIQFQNFLNGSLHPPPKLKFTESINQKNQKNQLQSNTSRVSNYPEQVFNPLSYFQAAVQMANNPNVQHNQRHSINNPLSYRRSNRNRQQQHSQFPLNLLQGQGLQALKKDIKGMRHTKE